MRRIFAGPKNGAQSQERHAHSSIAGMAFLLINPKTSAYLRKKGVHRIPPQSSTSKVMTTKERELSQQLQQKEAEVSELHARFEGNASQLDRKIRNLLHNQTTMGGALEKRESDMLELSNGFKGQLDEKDKQIRVIRGYYNRLLHAYESQQRNSNITQRNADAEADELRKKLVTAEQELDLCRDDLFRMQPVCRNSDWDIIGAFDSLSEQLINWIDNETSAFEKANPDSHVGSFFSNNKDPDVERFLQMYPLAGEYLCRHIVNHYLLEKVFGPNVYFLGIPTEYTHMRLSIEHGMAASKPPRGKEARLSEVVTLMPCLMISDPQTVNIWRAETLSALAATQECTDLREEQIIRWTPDLYKDLSVFFPNFFGREEAMKRFHDQVTVPAMTIVSKLQGLASAYVLNMVSKNLLNCERVTREDLKTVVAIDLETGRTLKPSSVVVSDREGFIGEFVLSLEPSLHRANEGMSDTNLRRETWLVRLDYALGSRAPEDD